ncbi:MAG: hypothetical protein LBF59_05080, partial [Prevotellaceae bacterium]|nr:hypothetical protein [Prevotellaceae bacterium]
MIEKTENKYAGNAPAAGSPVRNRRDGKTSHTVGTLFFNLMIIAIALFASCSPKNSELQAKRTV